MGSTCGEPKALQGKAWPTIFGLHFLRFGLRCWSAGLVQDEQVAAGQNAFADCEGYSERNRLCPGDPGIARKVPTWRIVVCKGGPPGLK